MNRPSYCHRSNLVFVLLVALTLLVAPVAPADGLQQMEPKEFAQGVEYKLLMSRDDKVCAHMLQMFNDDLKHGGYENYAAHEEFRAIAWQKSQYSWMEGEKERHYPIEVASVDLNNDGTKDIVIRNTGLFGGYDRHVVYVFPSVTESKDKWTRDELMHSPGKISLYNWTYDLIQASGKGTKKGERTSTPSLATGLSVLEPFLFNGTTYISMRALYELAAGADPVNEFARIHVITKYRQGKLEGGTKQRMPQPGQTEDVCYYKVRTKKFVPGGE